MGWGGPEVIKDLQMKSDSPKEKAGATGAKCQMQTGGKLWMKPLLQRGPANRSA